MARLRRLSSPSPTMATTAVLLGFLLLSCFLEHSRAAEFFEDDVAFFKQIDGKSVRCIARLKYSLNQPEKDGSLINMQCDPVEELEQWNTNRKEPAKEPVQSSKSNDADLSSFKDISCDTIMEGVWWPEEVDKLIPICRKAAQSSSAQSSSSTSGSSIDSSYLTSSLDCLCSSMSSSVDCLCESSSSSSMCLCSSISSSSSLSFISISFSTSSSGFYSFSFSSGSGSFQSSYFFISSSYDFVPGPIAEETGTTAEATTELPQTTETYESTEQPETTENPSTTTISDASVCNNVTLSAAEPISTVYSPNYPNLYPNNFDCTFTITSDPDTTIFLTFDSLKVKWSDTCLDDFMELHYLKDMGAIRFCGTKLPPPSLLFQSDNNQFVVRFKTNEETQLNGFKMVATQMLPDTSRK